MMQRWPPLVRWMMVVVINSSLVGRGFNEDGAQRRAMEFHRAVEFWK